MLWRLTARFMVYFFTNISMVNVLYGSLATVIVVLLSLEIVFVILLLGAQVIAELEASSAAGVRVVRETARGDAPMNLPVRTASCAGG